METTKLQQLFFPRGVVLVTPLAVVSAVVILACIVAILFAVLAFNIAAPVFMNARTEKQIQNGVGNRMSENQP